MTIKTEQFREYWKQEKAPRVFSFCAHMLPNASSDVKDQIEEAISNYAHDRFQENFKPSPTDAEALESVAEKAEDLCKALQQLGKPSNLHNAKYQLILHAHTWTPLELFGEPPRLLELATAAKSAAADIRRKRGGRVGSPPKLARRELFVAMAKAWETAGRGQPDSGKTEFLDFLCALNHGLLNENSELCLGTRGAIRKVMSSWWKKPSRSP